MNISALSLTLGLIFGLGSGGWLVAAAQDYDGDTRTLLRAIGGFMVAVTLLLAQIAANALRRPDDS